jgi:transposase
MCCFELLSSVAMRYSVSDLAIDFPDEAACLEWLVSYRWPSGITCKVCMVVTKHHRVASRRSYSCDRCGHHVHPTAGTILHKTTTPLTKWFYLIHKMSVTRSGVSAKQVERELGVSYPTAWRMMHAVRSMMTEGSLQLSGEVEIDETFVHPNTFKRSSAHKKYGYVKGGRRTGQVIFGMVERGGRAKVWHVRSTGARVLLPLIEQNVKYGTIIHSDSYISYRSLQRRGFEHRTTNHSRGEYYREDSYTQNIENVWSHFKRGIKGVYRHVGNKHLQNYAQEYAWRYSHRNAISLFWALMDAAVKPVPKS